MRSAAADFVSLWQVIGPRTSSTTQTRAAQYITWPFGDSQYSRSILVQLVRTSTDTSLIMQAAQAALRSLVKPGFRYAKAGVMLLELQPDSVQPGGAEPDDGALRYSRP